jgi:general secretion pathway protein I
VQHSDARRSTRGFTLLEILVAMAIVGLLLVGVFMQMSQTLIAAALMRDRSLAHWVALDRLAELRLAGELPDVGERSDQVEMAGVEWSYVLKFSDVGVENFRRVDITVSFADREDRPLSELIGFLGQPAETAAGPVWTPLDPNAEFTTGTAE